MKHFYTYCWIITSLLLSNNNIAQTLSYAQLSPGDNSKIIFQIKPNRNLTDVVAFIDFYTGNNIIKQNVKFWVTNNNQRYVYRDVISQFILNNYVQNADFIKLKFVNEKAIQGQFQIKNSPDGGTSLLINGTNINSEIANSALEDINRSMPQPTKAKIISVSDAPCIAGINNRYFYFFSRNNEGNIFYSSGILGGGLSRWKEVEGNGISSCPPSVGTVGNHIYLTTKRSDNMILLNQADMGGNFGDWFPMNFISDTYPAVTGAGNKIYFFAKSQEGRVYFNYATLGSGGVGWKEVDGNVFAGSAPAAAAIKDYVFVAVKGRDQNIYYNQGTGGKFGQWFPMKFETNVAPSLLSVGDYIFIFATKTDGQIFYNRARLTQAFEGWKVVEGNGRTDLAVSAGAVGNHIFITMKGRDGKPYLNQADLGGSFNSFWSPIK